MSRKAIIAIGTALAGAGVMLATQGSAHAEPAAPVVAAQKTTTVNSEKQPAIIRSAVARAAVHARAAVSSSAVNNAIEHASVIASLGSAPKDGPGSPAGPAEGIFDQ
ncbi:MULTISPECIES: hypothetical protein [unclassified Streptomyces]|uniref:hypothetical protein n=1 Tax=unclassified Streptomyces TaxID=2593676 RepID=UPI0029BBD6B7|nr:hypothetical protein [Streptomyces sp. WI03-4A]MDX2592819.1 hypothetical protein [Streptomyces sp. WI03-4A]